MQELQDATAATNSAWSAAEKTSKTAQDAAHTVAETLSNETERLAETVIENTRATANAAAEKGINHTEHLVRSIGRAVEAGSESLAQDGLVRPATFASATAEMIDRAALELDAIDAHGLIGKAENFARSNPMLTFGALALAGFALASAVKAKKTS